MELDRLFSAQLCPVCGFPLDFAPWAAGIQPERPCPCCGTHFGYDDKYPDRREAAYRTLRRHWIRNGMRWWSITPVPPDFNPAEQLANLERMANEPPEWPGAN